MREPNQAALKAAHDAGYFTTSDPGIGLFNACLKAGAPMTFTPGMRILEVGCCEADFLHPAHKAWPDAEIVGIDTRCPSDRLEEADGKIVRLKANVMDADLFPAESFDACVSLSAIEHVGLGHYRDPVDPDGDTKAMASIWKWLKPGGWFYFDVPYDPTGYRVQTTECRVYDDVAVTDRFLPRDSPWWGSHKPWVGFVHAKHWNALIDKPSEPVKPFHYVAMVWRKA